MNYKIIKKLVLILDVLLMLALVYVLVDKAVEARAVEREEQEVVLQESLEEPLTETEQTEKAENPEMSEESDNAAETAEEQNIFNNIERQKEMLREESKRLDEKLPLYKDYNEEEMQQLIQTMLSERYAENTLIALDIKALILESFGYNFDYEFYSDEAFYDEFDSYVRDSVISTLVGNVAGGKVGNWISTGISGAVDGIQDGDGISAGVKRAATDGVYAEIQDAPKEFISKYLGDSVGALGDVISESVSYDKTPEYLLQGIADGISNSSGKILGYIEKDIMTSADVSNIIYEYYQYGTAVNDLNQIGGSIYISSNWNSYYEQMQELYDRFIYNEQLIKFLNGEESGEDNE